MIPIKTKIYLAIPYSGMLESSYEQANHATAHFIKEGFNVFSPITHSHPLKEFDLPTSWDFWEPIDYQFLDWADELYVVIPKEGMEKVVASPGVQAEILYAKLKGMKVHFVRYNEGLEAYTGEPIKKTGDVCQEQEG